MNVNLTDDLAAFVAESLSEGYQNQSEVVRDALRLLRHRSEQQREVRKSIAARLADAERPDGASQTSE